MNERGMPYYLEPMHLADVPEVEAIERASFTSPWTRRAYEYDLTENPLAHYLVVREGAGPLDEQVGQDDAQPVLREAPARTGESEPPTWRQRLGAAIRSLARALPFPGMGRLSREAPSRGPRTPVLGFVGLWMAVEEAHLVTIAVHPDYRGRGLGELMLLGVLDLAAGIRASTVFLEVRVSNVAAKRMYDKYGFILSRVRKAYYSDNGEDALEMVADGIGKPQYQARLQRLRKMLLKKMNESQWQEEPSLDGGR
jgi:ribosomal-protein-alanine N-acetyltransferase